MDFGGESQIILTLWCFVKFDARVGTLSETHTVTKCYEPHREDGRNYRENRKKKTKVFRRCVVCAQNWDNLKIGAVIWVVLWLFGVEH